MRVAVISDIHSNLHALEAALETIDRGQPDEIWCLGDGVGYGPRPAECCRVVAERAALCLAGDHDLGVRGDVDLDDSAPHAAAAAWRLLELDAGAASARRGDYPGAETNAGIQEAGLPPSLGERLFSGA